MLPFLFMSTIKTFILIATLEAISYLVLLGLAMPAKYFLNMPIGVKVVGWAHGVLFVAYCGCLVLCWIRYRWDFIRVVLFFLASLLPFLPFLVERKLRKEYQL